MIDKTLRKGENDLRNKTQKLWMGEIVRLHELVFMKGQQRFFDHFFLLKKSLYKKYNISF